MCSVAQCYLRSSCRNGVNRVLPLEPLMQLQQTAAADVQGEGDVVTARVLPDRPGQVVIDSIQGDGGRLSLDAPKNCVGEQRQQFMLCKSTCSRRCAWCEPLVATLRVAAPTLAAGGHTSGTQRCHRCCSLRLVSLPSHLQASRQ